jgi:cephalosporin hydroxylase
MRFADLPAPPAHPLQSLVEFGALWDLAACNATRRVLEVGSADGGSLWYWLQLPGVEEVTTIDLAVREEWQSWSDRLHIYEGNSHGPNVVQTHIDALDLLFLDGDHTYEGVHADFHTWSPLVRKGGVVAFHDTVVNGTRDEPGVRKFVEELKRTWRWLSIEFFDPDGAGITAFVDAT